LLSSRKTWWNLCSSTACWYVTDSQPLLGLSWSQHQVHVYYLCCLW
jgi:hypothetical protein